MSGVVAARLARQLLAGERARSVAAVLDRVVGVQAQAVAPSRLAFRPRSDGLTVGDVDEAAGSARVVRTWLMRGTLHLVDAADLDWLLALFGGLNRRAGGRRRAQLGLTTAVLAAAEAALPDVLDRPLSRSALVERLRAVGVGVEARGQAPAHLMGYAASTGLICRGPELAGDEPSYVLTERWLGRRPELDRDRDADLVVLARRYLAGYGPASVADFGRWSGLPVAEARSALARLGAAGDAVEVPAGPAGLLALRADLDPVAGSGPSEPGGARLLGGFDTLLLGYEGRSGLVEDEFASRIQAGGGMITPAALDDGRIVATWSIDRSRKAPVVILRPFRALPPARLDRWEAEVADLARFLGEPLSLTVAP